MRASVEGRASTAGWELTRRGEFALSLAEGRGVAFPCREKDMNPSGIRKAGYSRGRSVGFLGSCYEGNCVPQKRYVEVLTHGVF